MKMPQFKIAISEARIHRTVRRMARQLDVYYAAQAVSQITVVCVMNATFVFCADLVRCLKTPARIVFTRARSYQGARKGKTRLSPIAESLRGRHVLVLDTIYDTGGTMARVLAAARRQTQHVTAAVLIVKTGKQSRPLPPEIRFIGMELPGDPFVIGYGLDYDGEFRELKEVRIFR